MGQGSGRLGHPRCPLQKVHSSAGVPSSADPPSASTQTPHFTHGRINKTSALFSGPKQSPRANFCPTEHPLSQAALQAQNRLPLPEQKGMWARLQSFPETLPERRRKHQRSSQSLSASKNKAVGVP